MDKSKAQLEAVAKLKAIAEKMADAEGGNITWFDGEYQSLGIDWYQDVLYIADPNDIDGPTITTSDLVLDRAYETEPTE